MKGCFAIYSLEKGCLLKLGYCKKLRKIMCGTIKYILLHSLTPLPRSSLGKNYYHARGSRGRSISL